MGISHDIRPKKVYHYSSEEAKIKVEEPKIDSEGDSSSIDGSTGHEQLEDDFFYDERRRRKEPLKTGMEHKSPVPKWLATIFVLALFGLLAYQNYDLVLKYVGLLPQDKTESVEKSETYSSSSSTPSSTAPSASTTTETPATTTTTPAAATPAIDKSAITLSVLNGNGIKGSAETISQTLQVAGFNPSKVANANSFSYNETYVYYQTGKSAEAKLVADALAGRTVISEESNTIAGKYNVLVVVGKQ